jgi:hypothetical protein
MPIYQFVCSKNHLSEAFHSIHGNIPGTMKCESCGRTARKIITMPAVHMPAYSNDEIMRQYGLDEKKPANRDEMGWKRAGLVPKTAKWNPTTRRYETGKKTFIMGGKK